MDGSRRNFAFPQATLVTSTPFRSDQTAKASITYPDFTQASKELKVDNNDLSWVLTIRKKLNTVRPNPYPFSPCTIFRVPENIRCGDIKAYEPFVVSIGPYHHVRAQNFTSHDSIQDHKWQCVRYLLSRHRSRERATELLDRCLMMLKALDCEVRSCYSSNLQFDQQKLAFIMLLDGCFLIHLLLKQEEKEKGKNVEVVVVEEMNGDESDEKQQQKGEEEEIVELNIGDEEEKVEGPTLGMLWMQNLIVYDILKLENQIPFFIIQNLFDLLKTPIDQGIDLAVLALKLFECIHPNKSKKFTVLPKNKIHHLLHLFHSTLIPSMPRTTAMSEANHFTTSPEWVPCATELKMSGIKFNRNEIAQCFLDVSFKDGLIAIPLLRIYDYTPSLFRNLIAFEQCFPDTKSYVTIYAIFMDCMIDTAEDVKLLDLKGILVNRLSTDEAVANLFNQLCNQIHYASDRNYLEDVFIQVKKYYESKWHRWRAGLIRDYFNNPWAGIAVVAAVVLFLLTIEQSFFAAFSYFCPP